MSHDPDPQAVLVATKAFLAAMRREFIKKRPNDECPVLNIEDYSRPDQLRLLRSIRAALTATSPENLARLKEG